jgi:hypothetical protein
MVIRANACHGYFTPARFQLDFISASELHYPMLPLGGWFVLQAD